MLLHPSWHKGGRADHPPVLRPQPMFMGFIKAALDYAENPHPQHQAV
jgi:hypothetical protein